MDFKDLFKSEPEAEGKGFKTIPEGSYSAIIDSVSIDLTKTPHRISVTYVVLDSEFKGNKLFANYSLQGQGIGFLKKDLKALGLDYSNISKPEDLCTLLNSKVGIACAIFVKPREYNGKIYNGVYLNGIASTLPANHPAREVDEFGF